MTSRDAPVASAAAPVSDGPVTQVPWERIEQFVSQLTHDVRNGLNAIDLQLTLLGQLSTDAETLTEVKTLRGTVMDVARQLQGIKAAGGPNVPHLLRYPAADFFEDLRDRFLRLHPRDAEKVSWKIAVGDSTLEIDPEMMLLALLEILSNALHFGRSSLAVEFAAETRPDGAVAVTLREAQPTPPALACAEWGRKPLFSTRRGAYGLGLFRVRRIIEAHRGTFDAEYFPGTGILQSTVTLRTASRGGTA